MLDKEVATHNVKSPEPHTNIVDFETFVSEVRARITGDWDWYPYSSLGSLETGLGVLTGERRRLLEFPQDEPVLDLGCGDGDNSFFLERLGHRVIAFDRQDTNMNGMRGVRAMAAALNSGIEIRDVNFDTMCAADLPQSGLSLCLGVLYHLRNPIQFLEVVARRSGLCLLSTRVMMLPPNHEYDLRNYPIAYLAGEEELNNDDTNYWIFTPAGLHRLLARSGWEVLDWAVLGSAAGDPVSPENDARVYCLLRSKYCGPLTMARLDAGWHRLEEGLWRWTEKRFDFAFDGLRPAQPYVLQLGLTIPQTIVDRLGPLRFILRCNGEIVGDRVFTEAASNLERFAACAGESGSLQFHGEFDRALAPSASDLRELASIVYLIRLEE